MKREKMKWNKDRRKDCIFQLINQYYVFKKFIMTNVYKESILKAYKNMEKSR